MKLKTQPRLNRGQNSKLKRNFLQKGFTLIELLVVIAVLGVLATGVLVLIDPIDKLNQANDSKVQNDVGAIGRSAEAYAVTHSGFYPATIAELVTAGELKFSPVNPSGYIAYGVVVPVACVAGGGANCTYFIVYGEVKAKRYTALATPLPRQRYETFAGSTKVCQVTVANSTSTSAVCP